MHPRPVVLLHGIPEFSYCWRHQLSALVVAGFHAIAPDFRGYDLSDRPLGISNRGAVNDELKVANRLAAAIALGEGVPKKVSND